VKNAAKFGRQGCRPPATETGMFLLPAHHADWDANIIVNRRYRPCEVPFLLLLFFGQAKKRSLSAKKRSLKIKNKIYLK